MAHSRPFYRLVADGSLATNDRFNFGLNIIRWPTIEGPELDEPSDELVEEVANVVGDWFKAAAPEGPNISGNARLERVKLNRIGTDGHYMDSESHEYTFASPIPGTASTQTFPPQLAIAVSLVGATNPRGLGGRGRFYLPPVGYISNVSSTGKLSNASVVSLVTSAKSLIDSLNEVWSSPVGARYAGVGNTSPGSGSRAGVQQLVSSVRVGDVVDTVRSRRRQLVEQYEVLPIA